MTIPQGPVLAYNTLVVAAGVAAVGFAAGVVGSLALLRKRPLAADAAAHATLVGVAAVFLATGRRDLATLLAGALVSAVAGLAALVAVRRFTRTRDDAATALVIGVSFGAGVALLSGISARGVPGSAGLEQFLLGHTAALAARDAVLLAAVSCLAVLLVTAAFKELVAVAFDAAFAAATGWPVAGIDVALVALVAVMVVVGLPAAGAVLVTALVVIPPVAARQWTDRAATMVLLAGFMGLVAALVGVAASAALPGLPTGPLVVLAAAALCAASFLVAPRRGWLARRLAERAVRRQWLRGLALEHCLRAVEAGAGGCSTADIEDRLAGDGVGDRAAGRAAWNELVRGEAVVPAAGAGDLWQLSASGRAAALERRRRIGAWRSIIELAPEAARESLSIDLPAPEAVLDAGLIAALRRGTA
jgi:manganese/zinc/iron transport system permease protein